MFFGQIVIYKYKPKLLYRGYSEININVVSIKNLVGNMIIE